MQRVLILSAYALLGLALAGVAVAAKRRGRSLLGRPPIHPAAFALGKLSLIAAVAFPAIHASGVALSFRPVPEIPLLIGTALVLAGALLATAALVTLGARTKMGVGEDDGGLQTGGVYRVSRNPMYFGLYAMCAGGCLTTLSPAALALTLAGVAVHHRIILGEERFLKERFGEAWDRYAERVRRYL
jgi:protein-S-isoprenylcysteine O-methyltransferase Ste14